jgi:predicted glycosyltransferase involved in capsule biosynthesis
VFVFTDADSYVPAAQINHAIQMMEKSENGCVWLFPYDEYCSLTEDASQRFMEGARQELDCEYIFPSVSHPEAAVGGCVIVSRKAFETVGGYDERFIGWGEEDRAFEMALHTLVHPQVRLVGRLFHLWHPWREEECFGQPHFGVNRILCNRYREACENPQMMRQIVDAHR